MVALCLEDRVVDSRAEVRGDGSREAGNGSMLLCAMMRMVYVFGFAEDLAKYSVGTNSQRKSVMSGLHTQTYSWSRLEQRQLVWGTKVCHGGV